MVCALLTLWPSLAVEQKTFPQNLFLSFPPHPRGGIFGGFFFSEELRFALKHGYTLRGIEQAWAFQRGEKTFRTLIE